MNKNPPEHEKSKLLLAGDQNKKRNKILREYGIASVLAIVIALPSLIFLPFTTYTSVFLFFFPLTAFSAWYTGKNGGILTSTLSIALIVFYLIVLTHPTLPIWFLPSLLLLLIEGISITIFMYKSTHSIELKQTQEENEEYKALIRHLDTKLIKAEEEIRARDEFLSIATHELKTPLTSMLLQLQSAVHNIKNVSLANFSVEKLLKMIESTEQQSTRLSKMINDLLNVSLITTGRLDLELEEFDLSSVVKEVADRFSEKVKRDNYEIEVIAKESINGMWDKVRIEQVITNLISNATKYGDNKPISISVSKNHGSVNIIVIDEGIGIAPDKLSSVFGRFQRATSSHNYQGLGVGLYITHQIVTAHGGKIRVESILGAGSKFTVTLPLHTKPQAV